MYIYNINVQYRGRGQLNLDMYFSYCNTCACGHMYIRPGISQISEYISKYKTINIL